MTTTSRQSTKDAEWISAAYKVLALSESPMHVSEIEIQIKDKELLPLSETPSIPLEVLLTKEAAMGRRFTKADGPTVGFFSLLPENAAPSKSGSSPVSISQFVTNPPAVSTQPEEPVSSPRKYEYKYKQLKKTCKQMLNAALYDEIARIDKKIERTINERKALLLKVMADQNVTNHKSVQQDSRGTIDKSGKATIDSRVKDEPSFKKIKLEPTDQKARVSKSPEPLSITAKPLTKKQKNAARRAILIPPINLDSNGRPVLPLELPAGLTVYSLGEINDKPGYCRSECIYPVGYCSTREFASIRDLTKTCLYTCKAFEGLSGPKFEISPDDEPTKTFQDTTPEGCHNKLITFLRKQSGEVLEMTKVSDFFGLKHPLIKNLLQCSPGAQNCLEYSWCKFEVVRSANKATEVHSESDPCTSYAALVKHLNIARNDDGDTTPNTSDDEGEY